MLIHKRSTGETFEVEPLKQLVDDIVSATKLPDGKPIPGYLKAIGSLKPVSPVSGSIGFIYVRNGEYRSYGTRRMDIVSDNDNFIENLYYVPSKKSALTEVIEANITSYVNNETTYAERQAKKENWEKTKADLTENWLAVERVLMQEIKGAKKTRIKPIIATIIDRVSNNPDGEIVFHGQKFPPHSFVIHKPLDPEFGRIKMKLYATPAATEKLVAFIKGSSEYHLPDTMPLDWLSDANLLPSGEDSVHAMRLKRTSSRLIR